MGFRKSEFEGLRGSLKLLLEVPVRGKDKLKQKSVSVDESEIQGVIIKESKS